MLGTHTNSKKVKEYLYHNEMASVIGEEIPNINWRKEHSRAKHADKEKKCNYLSVTEMGSETMNI